MVLAEGGEADVLDEDHFVVLLGEGLAQDFAGVAAEAGREVGVHAGDAGRRLLQALAVGVFADGQEDLADGRLDALVIHVAAGGAVLGSQGRPARTGGGIGHAQRNSRKGGGAECLDAYRCCDL